MFKIIKRGFLSTLALALMLNGVTRAQESLTSASITGRVLDPSGAAIAHAMVSAQEMSTNLHYMQECDSQGRFRFAYLPPGE